MTFQKKNSLVNSQQQTFLLERMSENSRDLQHVVRGIEVVNMEEEEEAIQDEEGDYPMSLDFDIDEMKTPFQEYNT